MELIIQLFILFIVTALTNSLSILKTIFLSKGIIKPVYVVVFLDSLVFATIMKKITSDNSLWFIIAFAFGKAFGVFIASKIEKKLALGINQIDLLLNDGDKALKIADELRLYGYTVNNKVNYGIEGKKRYTIETILTRKENDNYFKILKELEIDNPTFLIHDINQVAGKININTK